MATDYCLQWRASKRPNRHVSPQLLRHQCEMRNFNLDPTFIFFQCEVIPPIKKACFQSMMSCLQDAAFVLPDCAHDLTNTISHIHAAYFGQSRKPGET